MAEPQNRNGRTAVARAAWIRTFGAKLLRGAVGVAAAFSASVLLAVGVFALLSPVVEMKAMAKLGWGTADERAAHRRVGALCDNRAIEFVLATNRKVKRQPSGLQAEHDPPPDLRTGLRLLIGESVYDPMPDMGSVLFASSNPWNTPPGYRPTRWYGGRAPRWVCAIGIDWQEYPSTLHEYAPIMTSWGWLRVHAAWFLVAGGAILLAMNWRHLRRRHKPLDHPACAECGYDLRAHRPGQRCPECGTVVPPWPGAVAAQVEPPPVG